MRKNHHITCKEALEIALSMNPDDVHIKECLKKVKQEEIKQLKHEIAQWKEEQARDNYYIQQFLKNVKQVEEEKQCKLMVKTLI